MHLQKSRLPASSLQPPGGSTPNSTQHHRSCSPLTRQINSLLHNAQVLFSPLQQSLHTHVFMGRPVACWLMCFCWKQASPAVTAPGIPWYQMVTMTRWLICAMANRGLKTHGKHAQCRHPGCAKPDLSAGVYSMSVNRFLWIWHIYLGFSQWSAMSVWQLYSWNTISSEIRTCKQLLCC